MTRRLSSKETRELDLWLRARGWEQIKFNKHLSYRFRNGAVLSLSRTPSDWRNRINTQSEAKRLERR